MIYDYENTIDFARKQGREERAAEIAKKMMELGVDIDIISKSTGLTVEQIKKL